MTTEEEQKPDKTIQTYAALGIGIVCILFGVPLWWKTTEVYRVSLPYSDIAELSKTQINCVILANIISFDANVNADEFGQSVLDKLNKKTSEGGQQSLSFVYKVNTRAANSNELSALSKSSSVEDLANQLQLTSAEGFNIVLVRADGKMKGVHLGRQRTAVVTLSGDIQQAVATVTDVLRDRVVSESRISAAVHSAWHTRKQQMDKDTMRAVQYHDGYDVTFTLINPAPSRLNVSWDIAQASDKYFRELIFKARDYTNIQIKSQRLYYVGLGVEPRKASLGDYYYLTPEDLPHIINSIEGYLASHVSNNPQLNFLIYAVPPQHQPLKIVDAKGDFVASNAFLSPRWGGVLIYNHATAAGQVQDVTKAAAVTASSSSVEQVSVDMKTVMQVFASQLRQLLGFQTPLSGSEITVAQPGHAIVLDWELEQWLRLRCVENTVLAVTVLQSLSDLLEKIPSIVINDDIGREVTTAVHHIHQSVDLLSQAKLRDAFLSARQAIRCAEKAFFDPSLLELLYFPEDQKFAIYIPLFLPIGIPVLMSLMQAAKWFKSQRTVKPKSD